MTRGHTPSEGEIEALIVDRYLESLLARRPADVTDLPAELRATAAALADGLPRYHPSFRFEEALAGRLAGTARSRLSPTDAASELIPFPRVLVTTAPDGRPIAIRPVVIRGVLTSAALSLAGAAYVAWRRGHAPTDPMARAVRAAARRRTA